MIILRKAGVRYRNPYQTRHTFASTLLSSGANPLYVAKQMGHRDTEMITRNYGRWIEQGTEPETRKQLLAFFAQRSPTLSDRIGKPA
jgi:integrase